MLNFTCKVFVLNAVLRCYEEFVCHIFQRIRQAKSMNLTRVAPHRRCDLGLRGLHLKYKFICISP